MYHIGALNLENPEKSQKSRNFTKRAAGAQEMLRTSSFGSDVRLMAKAGLYLYKSSYRAQTVCAPKNILYAGLLDSSQY